MNPVFTLQGFFELHTIRFVTFAYLIVFQSLAAGCGRTNAHSYHLDLHLIKTQTGMDPSQIHVLRGRVYEVLLDKGYKLERTELLFNVTSIDGVSIRPVDYPCAVSPNVTLLEASGEFFGYLEVVAGGSRDPSPYAQTRGAGVGIDGVENSPTYNVTYKIHLVRKIN